MGRKVTGASSNSGKDLDKVSTLGGYIHNIVNQIDKLFFHLKIVEQIGSYWDVSMKD